MQHHNYHKNSRSKQSASQAPHINRSHVDPEIAAIGDNSNGGAKSNRKNLFKMNGIVPEANTISRRPTQSSSLATVARIYEH